MLQTLDVFHLHLHHLSPGFADPGAVLAVHSHLKFVAGEEFFNPGLETTDEALGLTDTPLVDLSEEQLRPSAKSLEMINQGFRSN